MREVLRSRLFLISLLFFVLIVVGGVFYLMPVEREPTEDLAGTQERMKPLTETQKPTSAEAPVGDTSQDGHSQADSTFHAQPHEMPSDVVDPLEQPVEKNEAEFKETMATKTMNEQHQRRLADYAERPDFIDVYNFYKEHPNFVFETASRELLDKYAQAWYKAAEKYTATANKRAAEFHRRSSNVDKRPRIYTPNGTIWLDEGGNR